MDTDNIKNLLAIVGAAVVLQTVTPKQDTQQPSKLHEIQTICDIPLQHAVQQKRKTRSQ